MAGRKGKDWEAFSRKWLEEKYPEYLWFKLINPERIDWIGLGPEQNMMFVESKHITHKTELKSGETKYVYYTKANTRKREQLQKYFSARNKMESVGYKVRTAFLLCKGPVKSVDKEILWIEFDDYEKMPKSY